MLQKMVKQRNETIMLYEKGGRAGTGRQGEGRVVVIERFLPKQMSEARPTAVAEAVADPGASRSRTWAA